MAEIYQDVVNGTPGGTGAWNDPLDTIQNAFDAANGGDTVRIGNTGTNTLTARINWTAFGGTQDTTPDNRLCVRGWNVAGGEGADGWATIDCNGLAGMLDAKKNYVTWYHLDISNGNDAGGYSGLNLATQNTAIECRVHDMAGPSATGIAAGGDNYAVITGCRVENVVTGISSSSNGSVRNCIVINHSGRGMNANAGCTVAGCTTISGGGDGIYVAGDGVSVVNCTIVGDGTTSSIYGIELSSAAEAADLTSNKIQGWSGANNIGVNNPAGNAVSMLGYNTYTDNTLDESANISDDVDVYLTSTGPGPGIVVAGVSSNGGSAPTAEENATATLEKLLADHSSVVGSLAERMTRIPNAAPASLGGLMTGDANNRSAGIQGTVNTLDEIAGTGFSSAFALDQQATLADQYAEIKKLFDTETWAELTGVPGATPTTADVLMWLYMMARNALSDDRLTGQQTVRNDAGSSIGTASRSDDGDTFTRDKFTAS